MELLETGGVGWVPVVTAVGGILLLAALRRLPSVLVFLARLMRLLRLLLALKRQHRRVRRHRRDWTVVDDFLGACEGGGRDRTAVVSVDAARRWSYDAMDLLSDRVARWLLQKGFRAGDVLALFLPNSAEFACLWLGCAKIGVTAALLHASFAGKGLRHAALTALETTAEKRRYLVFGAELVAQVLDAGLHQKSGIHLRCLVGQGAAAMANLPSDFRVEAIDALFKLDPAKRSDGLSRLETEYSAEEVATALAHDLPFDGHERDGLRRQLQDLRLRQEVHWASTIFLIYTSGTTGLPKATRISHLRMWSAGAMFRIIAGLSPADGIYCALPLTHAAGGMLGIAGAFQAGCRFIVRSRLSVRSFAADCHTYDVTVLQYIGELARYLARAPPSPYDGKLRLRIAFGNGLRPDVWPRFRNRFRLPRIVEFYASTEGNCNLINNFDRPGALGFVPPLCSPIYPVRLFRFDMATETLVRCPRTGRCVEARTGETGQLMGLIRDDPSRRFDGYTDAAATEKKIAREVCRAGDAWFASGDLLRRDAWGFFYWVDRVGDTFRWKGENISTAQVAEVLTTCPAAPVEDANVYGVEVPGCDGRAGCARIVAAPSLAAFDFSALYAHLKTHLQAPGLPAFLRVVTQPSGGDGGDGGATHLTSTFKHQKASLRQEGYDLDAIAKAGDQVYVRVDAEGTYEPLTPAGVERIRAGEHKL